ELIYCFLQELRLTATKGRGPKPPSLLRCQAGQPFRGNVMAPAPQGGSGNPPCGTGTSTNHTPDPALESVARDDLSTVLRGQGALDGRANGVAQEPHRAVAAEPVPAAGVLAPVMVPVAGVVLVPGPEPLLAPGAGLSELVSVGAPLLRVGQAH